MLQDTDVFCHCGKHHLLIPLQLSREVILECRQDLLSIEGLVGLLAFLAVQSKRSTSSNRNDTHNGASSTMPHTFCEKAHCLCLITNLLCCSSCLRLLCGPLLPRLVDVGQRLQDLERVMLLLLDGNGLDAGSTAATGGRVKDGDATGGGGGAAAAQSASVPSVPVASFLAGGGGIGIGGIIQDALQPEPKSTLLPAGTRVALCGFQTKPELNGQHGVIKGVAKSGQYKVQLDQAGLFKVNAENLEKV